MPSHARNEKYWVATQKELKDIYLKDVQIQKMEPTRDQKAVWNFLTNLYPDYCKAVENLGICLDEMCQIQRRETVQRLFDTANTRLIELKNDLRKLDLAELSYLDDVLIFKKMIPQDIDIIIPAHIARESRTPYLQDLYNKIIAGEKIYIRPQEEEVIEVVVEEALKKKHTILDDEDENKPPAVHLLPHEDPTLPEWKREKLKVIYLYNQSINVIQRLYRAQIARSKIAKRVKIQHLKILRKAEPKLPSNDILLPFVIKIQKFWRGYYVRKVLKEQEIERQILIGMHIPSWKSDETKITLAKNQERRRDLRKQYIVEATEFTEKERTRVLAVRAANLFEDITDEIMEWFSQWFYRTGTLDEFPSVDDGGTLLVVTGQTKSLKEWEEEEAHRLWLEERYRQSPELRAKDKEEADKLKAEEKERMKEEKRRAKQEAAAEAADDNPPWKFNKTPGLDGIKQANIDYTRMWGFKDPADNPFQETYNEFITEDAFAELSLKLRPEVDAIMRIELQILKDAINVDRARLGLGPTPVPKPPKQKKKKVPKDPTADRTTEDLFQELVDAGIIHPYPYTTFDDFIADYNYYAYEKRQLILEPPPCMRDVIHAVITSCVLPLGSKITPRPNGVLITGPRGCGKKHLVNAICTSTGAVLFDLTPAITARKYPGAKGLKILLHLLKKMAKILQPSIFFMDGIEKPFYLKVPLQEANNDTKLLKSALAKQIVRCGGADDQILFISTSREPWAGTPGPIFKCAEKIILMPRLEYNTLLLVWQKRLLSLHGVNRDFDCSSLARLTVGYPYRFLMDCADQVLTTERIIKLKYKPLTAEELLRVIVAGGVDPVSLDEYDLFNKWYKKTPLGAKRLARTERIQHEMLLEAKLAAKAAKK